MKSIRDFVNLENVLMKIFKLKFFILKIKEFY